MSLMILRGCACIALSLVALPAAEAACVSHAPTAAAPSAGVASALVRLEALRQRVFNSPTMPGDYGIVTLYASQARKVTEPRLVQLFTRAANDQFARLVWLDVRSRRSWANGLDQDDAASLEPDLVTNICQIDAENHAWLKADIEHNGWYKISTSGKIADDAAWVMVQHSDEDVGFQQEIMTMLGPLVSKGETSKDTYALLFDRVAVNTGRQQRYGTQGSCSGSRVWAPSGIENPSQVDSRRARMGLPSMSSYIAEMAKYCP